MTQFDDVPDLHALYAALPTNERVAKVFKVAENRKIAESLGITLPKRTKESDLVAQIRAVLALTAPETPDEPDPAARECQGCVLTGRRWYAVSRGEPIKFLMDRPALKSAYAHAERLLAEAMVAISLAYPAIRFVEATDDEVPDLLLTANEDDGFGGTLGFTVSYDGTEDADIDVGEDEFLSVRINMDPAERWNVRYFSTVLIHELFHALGLDHAPSAEDIMYARYTGYKEEWGDWTHAELTRRYIGTPE